MLRMAHSISVLLALLLVACGPAAPGGITPAPPVTPAPQPTAGPTTAAGANDILITYRKTGGIAGIDETMTVHADGTLDLISRGGAVKQAQAAPDEIDRLRQVLGSDDFARLEPSYPAVGADLFTYTLIVPASPAPRTITTMDGAQRPPALDQVLEALEALRAKFK